MKIIKRMGCRVSGCRESGCRGSARAWATNRNSAELAGEVQWIERGASEAARYCRPNPRRTATPSEATHPRDA